MSEFIAPPNGGHFSEGGGAGEVKVQANTQAGKVHKHARVSALEQHDSEAERSRAILAG